MLRNDWTDAWERPDSPDPLPMPLQYMVSGECVSRGSAYPDKALDVMFNPVGQVVGQMDQVRKARDVVLGLVEEYVEAVDRLNALNA